MYIIKNALRCIGRSKGRNVLISIIALVIAVSACLGLSIRQAAESAKESTLSELSITATISYDRSSMMNDMMAGGGPGDMGGGPGGMGGGGFDRDQFKDMMGSASELTLEEYQKYADAESVQDFCYTLTAASSTVSNTSSGTKRRLSSSSDSLCTASAISIVNLVIVSLLVSIFIFIPTP